MTYRIPFPITTEAGKKLWTDLNQRHGSATWGTAGELIPQIEQEVQERIIELLSTHFIDDEGFQDDGLVSLDYTIALIKGENNE